MKLSSHHSQSRFLLIVGGCAIFLLSFTGNAVGVPCWLNSDGLRGPVKILEQRQYDHSSPWALVATWEYDPMGKETQVKSGGEREGITVSSITATNIFNGQGQVTRQVTKRNNGSYVWETLYAYDNQGNQNVEVWYDTKGFFESLDFREFDEQGNCIKAYHYRSRGDLNLSVQRAEYRYNKLGKKVEEVKWRNDGTKNINRYSEKGNLLEIRFYTSNGELDHEIHIGYDVHGNQVESRTLNSNGRLVSHSKDTYECDNKKNWVKRISKWVTKDGKPSEEISITDRTITYHELQDPTLRN